MKSTSDKYVLYSYNCIGNTRLNIKELQSSGITTETAPKWYELGIALLDDDQSTQLQIINSSYTEATRRCTEMFIYWLQSHPYATWYQLIDALKSQGVELNNVARMVEMFILGLFIEHALLCTYCNYVNIVRFALSLTVF